VYFVPFVLFGGQSLFNFDLQFPLSAFRFFLKPVWSGPALETASFTHGALSRARKTG